MQLDDIHVKEYHRLKNVAARQSAQLMQELDSINREQKSDQDRLDNANRCVKLSMWRKESEVT